MNEENKADKQLNENADTKENNEKKSVPQLNASALEMDIIHSNFSIRKDSPR